MKPTFAIPSILAMVAVWMFLAPLTAQQAQTTMALAARQRTAGERGRTQWDGIFTEEQAKRGAVLYAEYCASCHGVDLAGGEREPSLRGAEFSAAWNDVPLGELFDRIRTSMPQNAPNSLSRQQNADILAFILEQSNFPAGREDLPTESDALNTIRFVMTRP